MKTLVNALRNKLRNNRGFTLVEVAVSSAAMTSLLAVFALMPNYKASLARIEQKQTAYAIIKEVSSQLENANQDTAPQITIAGADENLDGADDTKSLGQAPSSTVFNNVRKQSNRVVYTVTITSATASESVEINGTSATISTSESNIGKITISVSWKAYKNGSIIDMSPVFETQTLYNEAIF
jgi:Tfp pilus assembly protein PilE